MSAAAAVLDRRIDEAADGRERRASAPLGVGYYAPDLRAKAKSLAAAMLAAAEGHGIKLEILDHVGSLADMALDAVSLARRER